MCSNMFSIEYISFSENMSSSWVFVRSYNVLYKKCCPVCCQWFIRRRQHHTCPGLVETKPKHGTGLYENNNVKDLNALYGGDSDSF